MHDEDETIVREVGVSSDTKRGSPRVQDKVFFTGGAVAGNGKQLSGALENQQVGESSKLPGRQGFQELLTEY